MKSLIALLTFSNLAYGNVVCTSRHDSNTPTVRLEISDSPLTAIVTVYGFSRNNFEAVYNILDESKRIPHGQVYTLKKTVDRSTWKQMPHILELESLISIRPFNMQVLKGLSQGPVFFNPDNCDNKIEGA